MGLALCAIRDLEEKCSLEEWKKANPDKESPDVWEDKELCIDSASYAKQEEYFPGRLSGIEPDVVYSCEGGDDDDIYGMGAYSTYNFFRNTLTDFDLSEGRESDIEFEPICEFSDCSGIIAKDTAEALYYALNKNREDYLEFLSSKLEMEYEEVQRMSYFYDTLTTVCENAKQNGAIIFC